VLVIISSAKLFSQILAFTGTTTLLLEFIVHLDVNRWLVFAAVMILIWIVCMFIDEVGVMLIAVPILTPVVNHLGFDPIWFWMMLLVNFTLGGITPPIGYANFVFKLVAPPDTTMEEIMSAAWPIVGLSGICIVMMCLFPGAVTWLPSVAR
jgi:TRAP-type C4-dicarboxylate transport system permease large subunit